MKKFISLLLTLSLSFSLAAPVFAIETLNEDTHSLVITSNTVELSDEQLIQQMSAMGFSQAEINTILLLEQERIMFNEGFTPANTNASKGFPSNPKEGDWYYSTFTIHFSTITLTAFGLAGALIKGGVGAGVALTLARAIINEVEKGSDYDAVEITMSYRYGTTNDGVPGWTPGPVEWKLIPR